MSGAWRKSLDREKFLCYILIVGSALDKTHWAACKDFKHEGLKDFDIIKEKTFKLSFFRFSVLLTLLSVFDYYIFQSVRNPS